MYVTDTATVRRVDAVTIENGTPGYELMERAGRAAATILRSDSRPRRGTTLVVCGKGNNGGDGLVVARELHLAFDRVVAALVDDDLEGDAARALADARASGVRIELLGDDPADRLAALHERFPGDVIVDAVFGTGLRLPLRAPYDALVGRLGNLERRVFALDGPSGLDGDTGEVDPNCPVADASVSFGLMKWGMVLKPGRRHCGSLHLVDLGFDRAIVEAQIDEDADTALYVDGDTVARWWPRRAVDAHKYRAGSVFAVGGSAGMSGAIALGCNAAYRSGAGLVEATVPRSVAPTVDTQCVETLVHPAAETDQGGLADSLLPGLVERSARHGAALIGPGAGSDHETATLLMELISEVDLPMVVDADGLNASSRTSRPHEFGPHTVITPHSGELSRLIGVPADDIEDDRRHWAREAARRLRATVLHKGAPTFVAHPDGRLAVIGAGGPELASAGTGDVLAGAVAALLAAGLAPFEAACAAAFAHGDAGARAAERCGVAGVMARDVLDELAAAVRALELRRLP